MTNQGGRDETVRIVVAGQDVQFSLDVPNNKWTNNRSGRRRCNLFILIVRPAKIPESADGDDAKHQHRHIGAQQNNSDPALVTN